MVDIMYTCYYWTSLFVSLADKCQSVVGDTDVLLTSPLKSTVEALA